MVEPTINNPLNLCINSLMVNYETDLRLNIIRESFNDYNGGRELDDNGRSLVKRLAVLSNYDVMRSFVENVISGSARERLMGALNYFGQKISHAQESLLGDVDRHSEEGRTKIDSICRKGEAVRRLKNYVRDNIALGDADTYHKVFYGVVGLNLGLLASDLDLDMVKYELAVVQAIDGEGGIDDFCETAEKRMARTKTVLDECLKFAAIGWNKKEGEFDLVLDIYDIAARKYEERMKELYAGQQKL